MKVYVDSFRNFLEKEFKRRAKFNAAYSTRAFARDCGLSPSTLSEYLAKKKALSSKRTGEVAKKLGCSKRQIHQFTVLASDRAALIEVPPNKALALYHVLFIAILQAFELDEIREKGVTRDWLVENMAMEKSFIDQAVEHLTRHQFLQLDENGFLHLTVENHSTFDVAAIPIEQRNGWIDQILGKVRERFDEGDRSKQYHDGIFFAIDPEFHCEFKRRLKEIFYSAGAEFEQRSTKKEAVALLSFSLVELTRSITSRN